MTAEANPRIDSPLGWTDIGCAFGTHKDTGVTITPVVGVAGEKAGRHTHCGHPLDLIESSHLRVNDQWASLGPLHLSTCRLNGIERIFNRFIAIGMDCNLNLELVQPLYLMEQVLARHRRITAVIRIVVVRRVVGFAQIARETLNTAIGNDLDARQQHSPLSHALGTPTLLQDLRLDFLKHGEKRKTLREYIETAERSEQLGEGQWHPTRRRGGHTHFGVLPCSMSCHTNSVCRTDIQHFIHHHARRGLLEYPIRAETIG